MNFDLDQVKVLITVALVQTILFIYEELDNGENIITVFLDMAYALESNTHIITYIN